MAEWRDRGYVPDSDEEDTLDSQESAGSVHYDLQTGAKDKQIEGTNVDESSKSVQVVIKSVNHGGQSSTALIDTSNSPYLQQISELSTILLPSFLNTDSSSIWDIPEDDSIKPSRLHRPVRRTLKLFSSSPDPIARPETPPNQQNVSNSRSTSSSPLSTLSRSPSPPPALRPLPNVAQEEPRRNHTRGEGGYVNDHLEELHIQTWEQLGAVRRSKRKRDLIQLHPFLVEGQRYQRLMKDRGVKPVRVTDSQVQNSPPRRSARERDDDDEYGDSGDIGTGSIRNPPLSTLDKGDDIHQSPSTPQQDQHDRASDGASYDDDELPDLREILNRRLSASTQYSNKRRRINNKHGAHSEVWSKKQTIAPFGGSATQPMELGTPSTDKIHGLLYDDLTSPPPSTPSLLSRDISPTNGFRIPPLYCPKPLPTPATSSAARDARNKEGIPMPSSDTESRQDDEPDDGQAQLRSPTQELAANNDRLVHRYQRKIRGVLPASWLKLDMQTRKKTPEPTQWDFNRQRRTEQVKGVARITRRTANAPVDGSHPVLISDDSSASEDGSTSTRTYNAPQGFAFEVMDAALETPVDLDDIQVEDRVDLMLPAISRVPRKESGSGKQQSRLNRPRSIEVNHEPNTSHRPTKVRSNYQPRITERLPVQRKSQASRPAPPRLGVLDSVDLKTAAQRVPRFLKLAAREARSKPNKGRHSPTRKFVRLSTKADTEDAASTLFEWRKEVVPQEPMQTGSRGGTSKNREPLKDRILNGSNVNFESGFRWNVDKNIQEREKHFLARPQPIATELVAGSESRQSGDDQMNRREVPRRKQPEKKNTTSRHILSSLRTVNGPRIAQLEAPSTTKPRRVLRRKFVHSLNELSWSNLESYKSNNSAPSLALARFLAENEATTPRQPTSTTTFSGPQETTIAENGNDSAHGQAAPNRPRKRQPKRVDTEVADVRQLDTPIVILDDVDDLSTTCETSGPVLTGLSQLEVAYSIDFNITPLQTGTFFHQTSFIGSGEFARSLNFKESDLDQARGYSTIRAGEQSFCWGPWNESVSFDMGLLFQEFASWMEKQDPSPLDVDAHRSRSLSEATVLRCLVLYFRDHLSFIDRIDRESFARRCLQLFQELSTTSTMLNAPQSRVLTKFQVTLYLVVLANEVLQIIRQLSANESHLSNLRKELEGLVHFLSESALCHLSSEIAVEDIRSFLESNKHHERREPGIRDEDIYPTGTVIIFHVLRSSEKFWELWSTRLRPVHLHDGNGSTDVRLLEKLWHSTFSLLPLLEIDATGFYCAKSRFIIQADNWPLIQELVKAVTDIYTVNPSGQSIAFNGYFRTILSRCFLLVQQWGWNKSDKMLKTAFNFFALHQNLENIRNEETHGSPRFLDELGRNTTLTIEPSDRSFHILLKFVGIAVQNMRHTYSSSEISHLVLRLMPNHGRSHPKEKPIRQSDLDALRNHHDLLCVLYWSSPAGFRPKLDNLKKLIHPASSHREACSINIYSWGRLARYQLSTDEPIAMLKPFAEWHEDFVLQMLEQHTEARDEAVKTCIRLLISPNILEANIAQNQRQIESLIGDALHVLSAALKSVKRLDQAQVLLSQKTICGVFGILDFQNSRLNKLIMQSLDLIQLYVSIWEGPALSESQQMISESSEDSQEFGDWSGLEEFYAELGPNKGIKHLHDVILEPLARLISSCFGSDISLDDTLLKGLVDCWTSVAFALVREGFKEWSNYLGSYGSVSWTEMRNTEQKRKYASYFFATAVQKDTSSYEENRASLLSSWISSLVERESMLKFQHLFTSALLNVDVRNPLLANLPFSMDSKTHKYHIRLGEFSERRLALIACVLSNMRSTLFEAECRNRAQGQLLRQEYRELVGTLMDAMKSNYQELGPENTTKGAYVEFVHRVVEHIQQHSVEICPVDRYFSDSAMFPLPATDPTYVVGRLKNYGLRLSEPGIPKQLVTFIQNVAERAATDGEQEYLVGQLCSSLSGNFETGDIHRPTLRAFLMQNVFPVYIELALDRNAGWPVTEPILLSINRCIANLMLEIDINNCACLASAVAMISSLFEAIRIVLDDLESRTNRFPVESGHNSVIYRVLRTIFSMINSAIPITEYLHRASTVDTGLPSYLGLFQNSCVRLANDLMLETAPTTHAIETIAMTDPLRPSEIKLFAMRELRSTITKNWSVHNRRFFVQRGAGPRKDIGYDVGNERWERDQLNLCIEEFSALMKEMGFAEIGGIEEYMSTRRIEAAFDGLFI